MFNTFDPIVESRKPFSPPGTMIIQVGHQHCITNKKSNLIYFTI